MRFGAVGLVALAALTLLAGSAFGLLGSRVTGLSDPMAGEGAGSVAVGQTMIAGTEVFNDSGAPVRFESVRLIPLRGFRTPRLVGLRRGHDGTGLYPAKRSATGMRAGLRTLRGIRLRSGKNAAVVINLEVAAHHSGDYGFSAVQFTVLRAGKRVRFATRGGWGDMCVGKHASVRLCPGYHVLGGGFGGSYKAWLRNEHNVSGNGVSRRIHRAFPLLDAVPTVTTAHRSVRAFDTVPVGATMLASNTPLATSAWGYLDDDYSPNTIVTVLHHSRGLQIYAEDYYGAVTIFSTGRYGGEAASGGVYGNFIISPNSHGPAYISTLVPSWIHHVEVRLENRRRLKVSVRADSVTYHSRQAFAVTYPIGHGKVLFLTAGNYTRAIPPNAVG